MDFVRKKLRQDNQKKRMNTPEQMQNANSNTETNKDKRHCSSDLRNQTVKNELVNSPEQTIILRNPLSSDTGTSFSLDVKEESELCALVPVEFVSKYHVEGFGSVSVETLQEQGYDTTWIEKMSTNFKDLWLKSIECLVNLRNNRNDNHKSLSKQERSAIFIMSRLYIEYRHVDCSEIPLMHKYCKENRFPGIHYTQDFKSDTVRANGRGSKSGEFYGIRFIKDDLGSYFKAALFAPLQRHWLHDDEVARQNITNEVLKKFNQCDSNHRSTNINDFHLKVLDKKKSVDYQMETFDAENLWYGPNNQGNNTSYVIRAAVYGGSGSAKTSLIRNIVMLSQEPFDIYVIVINDENKLKDYDFIDSSKRKVYFHPNQCNKDKPEKGDGLNNTCLQITEKIQALKKKYNTPPRVLIIFEECTNELCQNHTTKPLYMATLLSTYSRSYNVSCIIAAHGYSSDLPDRNFKTNFTDLFFLKNLYGLWSKGNGGHKSMLESDINGTGLTYENMKTVYTQEVSGKSGYNFIHIHKHPERSKKAQLGEVRFDLKTHKCRLPRDKCSTLCKHLIHDDNEIQHPLLEGKMDFDSGEFYPSDDEE